VAFDARFSSWWSGLGRARPMVSPTPTVLRVELTIIGAGCITTINRTGVNQRSEDRGDDDRHRFASDVIQSGRDLLLSSPKTTEKADRLLPIHLVIPPRVRPIFRGHRLRWWFWSIAWFGALFTGTLPGVGCAVS